MLELNKKAILPIYQKHLLKSGDKKTRRKHFFFAILKNNLTNWLNLS
jgi:hypothetical protein